jgi:hypothetical protein
MGKRWTNLPRDTFEGKQVTFAPTDRVDAYPEIATEFMSEIFELEPGDYLITDEADVLDFTPMDESDTTEIWHRIEAAYGITLAEAESGRLAVIFEAIANRRRVQ